jgi:hypothetical protein
LFPEGNLWQRSKFVGVVDFVEGDNATWLHQSRRCTNKRDNVILKDQNISADYNVKRRRAQVVIGRGY